MRGYSVDLRKKIVDAVRRRRPTAEVARIFGVGISSVKRYTKMAEEEGSLDPKKAPGKKRKLDESGRKLLEEDLRARPAATHEQRANFLDALIGVRVSKATICRLGHTRKKDRWARASATSSWGPPGGRSSPGRSARSGRCSWTRWARTRR
jgi:transposase